MAETYITHSIALVGWDNLNREDAILLLGNCRANFFRAGPPVDLLPDESIDENFLLRRANTIAGILLEISVFEPERLNILELQCDPDVFMETLLNNVRNEVISYQRFIHKTSKKLKSDLILNLSEAKKSSPINYERVDLLGCKT